MGGMVCLHKSDAELLKEVDSHFGAGSPSQRQCFIEIGEDDDQVLHTPGHTPGSLCFHIREVKALFTETPSSKENLGGFGDPIVWDDAQKPKEAE